MQYFGADALGSVRQIYNSSGQVIANKRYDPYGNVLAQNGVGTSNYGYTGEWSQMFAVRILMFDSVTGEANTCEGCDGAGVPAGEVLCVGGGAFYDWGSIRHGRKFVCLRQSKSSYPNRSIRTHVRSRGICQVLQHPHNIAVRWGQCSDINRNISARSGRYLQTCLQQGCVDIDALWRTSNQRA